MRKAHLLISSLLIGCSLIGLIFQTAQAQEMSPQVYVHTIKLDKPDYASGETIVGSFIAWNQTTVDVSKVLFHISLVSYQKDGQLEDVYDSVVQGPVYFTADEIKTIPFSFIIPQTIAGNNLGIRIQAFLDTGISLGWGDVRLNIEGDMKFVSLGDAFLTANGEKFDLQEGPTVQKGNQPSVSITFTNSSKFASAFSPKLKYFEKTISNTPLFIEQSTTTLNLKPGEKKTLTFPLSTFEYSPKVYLVEIDFIDAEGLKHAPSIYARYIIPGNYATLHSVRVDKTAIGVGDTFVATVSYTGNPPDISNPEASLEIGTAELNLVFYNEKDQVVASGSSTVNLDTSDSASVSLIANEAAQALRVQATITKGGKTLASYSTPLTATFDDARQASLESHSLSGKKGLFFIVGVVLALIILTAYHIRRKRRQQMVSQTYQP